MPHAAGQTRTMYVSSASEWHLPSCAHARQRSSWSMHAIEHAPHVAGQSLMTAMGFATHSPESAHTWHCVTLWSKHGGVEPEAPAAESPAEALVSPQTPHAFGHVFIT